MPDCEDNGTVNSSNIKVLQLGLVNRTYYDAACVACNAVVLYWSVEYLHPLCCCHCHSLSTNNSGQVVDTHVSLVAM